MPLAGSQSVDSNSNMDVNNLVEIFHQAIEQPIILNRLSIIRLSLRSIRVWFAPLNAS